ncbi:MULTISPECIES: energy transducer TonB [Niastella]|uniref:Energy transducer TonB n=1 Tax=Niastella soli TaxID=2821487 RepID=A0ABS3YM71_9BACT|nr:energy transducer TonB [Niastella soli]MBO9198989.1 energy transducer TonB [Niastella soli]
MHPVKLILTALLLVSTIFGYSQRKKKTKDDYFAFDENWKGCTDLKKAKYFTRRKKITDSCWQWDTYNMYGPLIKSGQYFNDSATVAHGRIIVYNKKGNVDSIRTYSRGIPHGTWYIYTDPLYDIQQTYNMGVLADTKQTVKIKGKKPKDTTVKEEKESAFVGGAPAWLRYLNRNLHYPERALQSRITGQVIVNFEVDTTGTIGDMYMYRSVEFSLDEEAMRLIHESPKWEPSTKEGKPVKAYKLQPLIFDLGQ